jgi:SOS-response transcriptional repressor LexA
MLTPKQNKLLLLIKHKIESDGICPSYAEMAKEMAVTSRASIFSLVDALQDLGFIERIPHTARSIKILRMPTDSDGSREITPWENIGDKIIAFLQNEFNMMQNRQDVFEKMGNVDAVRTLEQDISNQTKRINCISAMLDIT